MGGPPRPCTVVHAMSVRAKWDAKAAASSASMASIIASIAGSPETVPEGAVSVPGRGVAVGSVVADGGVYAGPSKISLTPSPYATCACSEKIHSGGGKQKR